MARVLVVAIGVGVLAIATLVAYVASNGSGHTGGNPYVGLAVFLPVAALGFSATSYCAGRRRALGFVATLVGVAGTILLVWLDRSNTLLPYDEWIRRGMP